MGIAIWLLLSSFLAWLILLAGFAWGWILHPVIVFIVALLIVFLLVQ